MQADIKNKKRNLKNIAWNFMKTFLICYSVSILYDIFISNRLEIDFIQPIFVSIIISCTSVVYKK